MVNKKTETVFKRCFMDDKVVIEVTDLIPQRSFIATVYVIGQEVAYRFFDYRFSDVRTQARAKSDAIEWLYGAMDCFEGFRNAGLIKENFDWGDDLFEEEE